MTQSDLKDVWLTQEEFDALHEYSCSVPTGQVIGKRWKYNRNAYSNPTPSRVPEWFMAEYVEDPDPEYIGINWSRIKIVPKDLTPELAKKLAHAEDRWK